MDACALEDFYGCNISCRPRKREWKHTLIWGLCEHAVEPEPTIGLVGVFTASDGEKSIGTATFPVSELAAKVEGALRSVALQQGAGMTGGTSASAEGIAYAAMAQAVVQMLREAAPH